MGVIFLCYTFAWLKELNFSVCQCYLFPFFFTILVCRSHIKSIYIHTGMLGKSTCSRVHFCTTNKWCLRTELFQCGRSQHFEIMKRITAPMKIHSWGGGGLNQVSVTLWYDSKCLMSDTDFSHSGQQPVQLRHFVKLSFITPLIFKSPKDLIKGASPDWKGTFWDMLEM